MMIYMANTGKVREGMSSSAISVKKLTKKRIKQLEKRERNKKDKEWKEAIRARDGAKCIICGETKLVHTHHIIPREVKALRWEIDNGICLCANHHKYSYDISPHKNPLLFIMFIVSERKEQLDRLLKKYFEL